MKLLRATGLFLCWIALAAPAASQQQAIPIVETTLEENEAIPGQPLLFRITVLVPTWLSKPIEFPPFEAPDLLAKRFEKSTTPTSRTIAGETWSGVTRVYRLSPMVAGTISVPQQEFAVLWAEPGKTEPIQTTVSTDAFEIIGTIPAEAADLSPFIAARALRLSQELSSESRVLSPGDSITRKVIVEVDGTSPFVLPTVLPQSTEIDGIASYPAEPLVEEKIADNWLSGSRTESISFVAESGGSGNVPAIELVWFNLETQQVETTRAEGFELSVDAPVARNGPTFSARSVATVIVAGAFFLIFGYLVYKYAVPLVRRILRVRQAKWVLSEPWAYKQLSQAIDAQDYRALQAAFKVWSVRLPQHDAGNDPDVIAAMLRLGRNLYGQDGATQYAGWQELSSTLAATRKKALQKSKTRAAVSLTPINPT